ncbi:MAG: tyrosine-protein phosphatase, partial [Gemmataceae bacterium]|nr:tyrosine-protein phosphatase [Gemmataceae bacterium]
GGALVAFAWEAGYVLLGPNFHCVTPDDAYRSGQPNAAWLGRTIDRHGIRSVINLRGDGHASAWYVNERRVADERDLFFDNVMLSAAFAPHERDLRRLVRTLDAAPRPVLFHCRSGGDRSGLVAAIYLLLYTDTPMDAARGQLCWRYGHNRYGRSACLHGVLDQYEAWLTSQPTEHRPEHLRHWIAKVYRKAT